MHHLKKFFVGASSACLLNLPISLAQVTYPIVDTSQHQVYDNYQGQDGHYLSAQPAYQDNGNGTVTDKVTGLMWTKNIGNKMTYAQALKGATSCNIGGYHDWRLPTVKELYSLIQLDGIDPDPRATNSSNLKPFIDNKVFDFRYGDVSKGERIIDAQFASATKYVSKTMASGKRRGNETVFGVNFADGRIKGYPIKSRRGEKTFFVLYVRGNSNYGVNQFKDNGNGTVTDQATGLMWQQQDSKQPMDWPSALNYAEKMTFAGYSDWRLPNAKELQSILDYHRSPDTTNSAAIDPIFQATAITNEAGKKDYGHYWTSSTHISSRGNDTATYFAFGRALGWMGRSGTKTLMDVHGAGAQRSDPKTGDAKRFPYGRGPQGDVIRIDNMVRLVRGGEAKQVTATAVAEQAKRKLR